MVGILHYNKNNEPFPGINRYAKESKYIMFYLSIK